jgi:hypothetical protein
MTPAGFKMRMFQELLATDNRAVLYAMIYLLTNFGCVIAQVVSRWFPTVAVWIRARFSSCAICGGQSGTGADFLFSTLVSPANHSIYCSILIIIFNHLGLVQ